MQQKLLATLDTEATTIEEVARDLAIAIAAAVDADDGGGRHLGGSRVGCSGIS